MLSNVAPILRSECALLALQSIHGWDDGLRRQSVSWQLHVCIVVRMQETLDILLDLSLSVLVPINGGAI